MPTDFIDILGYFFDHNVFDAITVAGSSTAKWGTTKLRVALVLDNTGSMEQSDKIGALKNATKSLLTILQDAQGTDGDVQVAIVPFVNGVNVGTDNVDATWLDWSYYSNSGGGGYGGSHGGGYGSSYYGHGNSNHDSDNYGNHNGG